MNGRQEALVSGAEDVTAAGQMPSGDGQVPVYTETGSIAAVLSRQKRHPVQSSASTLIDPEVAPVESDLVTKDSSIPKQVLCLRHMIPVKV